MLEIRNLSAGVEGKEILKGLSLSVKAGEVHAIMGPNGSGKSTLAGVLAGRSEYEVTGGSVTFNGADLLEMKPEERARAGVFLAFQYPVEIPGVNSTVFLKAALNECRKARGEEELDAFEFLALVKKKTKLLELDPALLSRASTRAFPAAKKSATRFFRWPSWNPNSPSSMKPIPAWTLTP